MTRRRAGLRVLTATAVAAVALLVAAAYLSGTRPSPEVVVVPPPGTARPPTASPAGFAFTPLDEPRPLPELRFVDGDGRPMTLTDFRGKVALLNVWATWCGPCREEMPTLDRLQAALGGPGFQVVPLSIDRAGLDAVRKFYDETGIAHLGRYVDGSGKASRDLGVVGLPTTLLLDRAGRDALGQGRARLDASDDRAPPLAERRPHGEPRIPS